MVKQITAVFPTDPTPRERFHYALGVFHGMWSTVEVTADFIIGRLLRVPDEEAHMITSGMMFGAKARLLSALLKRSDHPNRAAMVTALNVLRGEARRDVVVHGYQISDGAFTHAFVERSRGGDFKAKEHVFTLEEFITHVEKVIENGNALYDAIGAPEEEIVEFVAAARSLKSKA